MKARYTIQKVEYAGNDKTYLIRDTMTLNEAGYPTVVDRAPTKKIALEIVKILIK